MVIKYKNDHGRVFLSFFIVAICSVPWVWLEWINECMIMWTLMGTKSHLKGQLRGEAYIKNCFDMKFNMEGLTHDAEGCC